MYIKTTLIFTLTNFRISDVLVGVLIEVGQTFMTVLAHSVVFTVDTNTPADWFSSHRARLLIHGWVKSTLVSVVVTFTF